MQTLKISLRITKLLGKLLLCLLLALFSFIAILHLPPVQKQLTRAVSNYLSSKIEAKVYIQRIEFSILGHIILKDMTVWSRDGSTLFSIGKIEVTSSFFDLVTGDLIFDTIRIVGLDGQLKQGEDGLNIQFILDAFQPAEKRSATTSQPVTFQFKNVQLENIDFEFTSTQNGITVTNSIGMLTLQGAEYSTYPNTIKADKVSLQHSIVNILSTQHATGIAIVNTLKSDTIRNGTGITIKVMHAEIGDSDFSFHQNEVLNTPKFDPSHLTLQDININLSDILVGVRKDTVAAILHSLSAQFPGFKVDDARASVQWSHNRLVASDVHLSSNTNEVNADFSGTYDRSAVEETDIEIHASGRINPQDLSYFFSDSVMNHFGQWESTDLNLKGHYNLGKGEIKTLSVKTGNSWLQSSAIVGDILDSEKMYWSGVVVNASIGPEFKSTLTPFLQNINMPYDATLQLKSTGNLKKASVDGKVFTNWGNVKVNGIAGKQGENVDVDMNLIGEQIDLGQWINVSEVGLVNLSLNANGLIGNNTDVEVNGLINDIEIMDQDICNITLLSQVEKSNATVNLQVDDPTYKSDIHSDISFAGPLVVASDITFDDFKLGKLLHMDSTLSVSGDLNSKITIDQSFIEGYGEGDSIAFLNHALKYALDTLNFHALLSPSSSDFEYYSDHGKGKLTSNFDIRNSLEVIQSRLAKILKRHHTTVHPVGTRALKFNIELENPKLLQLLGIDVDDFSSVHVEGELDEQKQNSILQATSGRFKGYGISLDTLNTNLIILHDSISATMDVRNLLYNTVRLGDLNFDMLTKGDTAISNFQLSNDTITMLGLRTRIFPTDTGAFIYPDKLLVMDHDYFMDPKNAVYLSNNNIVLNHLQISRENMHISLDGDLNNFDASFQNVDLTPLNLLLSPDTVVINKGHLNGNISYSLQDRQLNLKANIDSLSLYNSNPLTVVATAESNGDQVPFEFLLTNTTNTIDLKGQYAFTSKEVDATMLMDINNPEIFTFLVSGVVDEMRGTLKGETKITGPIQKPTFKGHLQFLDVELTTVNPRFTFSVQNDQIALDNSALLFNEFTLYDQKHHPLIVDGDITTQDYQSYSYNLQLKAEDYMLMNKPDSASGRLKGTLVIDSDIKLKGNEKDTNVEAKLTIKDNTRLTFLSSTEDIELLKSDGIVDFIDPTIALDSALQQSSNFYDSLIASLPDFNLNSTVTIEDDATLRIVIDAQSGDYMETSGGAALELGYDRTGNLHLVGDYTIKQGVYRLSFYDLVKRNFTLVPNSSIHWSGSPENGDLNIKAVHTVQSNSIGLIGHEISESEKSIYKRSLNYEVGINIHGTLDKPIVTFSLDLPQQEKTNYPVLANKLDRLRQPEFQSELNKQVFGLLVLGGFLPETSGSDINSGQVATTAISNSVNSLLASQLNRFASQYIKGVNIDVGIQSYSDYSAPSGKTQTAMDFRVSKRIMDDRLSFEIGGDFDINSDQSGAKTGTKNYRGDIAIIYDLTGKGDKQLKLFNNETYDIVYQEIRNTGISLIFIREFSNEEKKKRKKK